MGFFDKVKEKAGEIADDAGRATKVAQAQMKLKSLQGDVEAAKKELGDVAFQLVAGGEFRSLDFLVALKELGLAGALELQFPVVVHLQREGLVVNLLQKTPPHP